MKPKKKQKQLRITEADFMLANRRAARLEEIAGHGKPVSFRTALHKSKKVYDRKRLKRAGIHSDDCPSSFAAGADRSCRRDTKKTTGSCDPMVHVSLSLPKQF